MRQYDEIVIIIVEDDKIDTLSLKKILIDNKIINQIKCFSNAEEALKEIKNNRNHYLVFIDINLPGMSGIDFVKELNKLQREKEIIYIITSDVKDVIDNFHVDLQGAVAFLPKPINPHRLLAIIDGVEIVFKKWEVQTV